MLGQDEGKGVLRHYISLWSVAGEAHSEQAKAYPTKRAPAPVSERFASRYQFPDEQGTPPDKFDFLSLESFEKMSHNPKFWLPLPDTVSAPSTAYLVLVRMVMYMGRPGASDEERNNHWEVYMRFLSPLTTATNKMNRILNLHLSHQLPKSGALEPAFRYAPA